MISSRKYLLFFLGIVVLFLAAGLINVYSATFYMNMENGDSPYYHLKKQMGAIGLGAFLGCFIAICPKQFAPRGFGKWCVPLAVVFLLVLVIFTGPVINGSRRWIVLAGFGSLQPSEFAKMAAVIWTASELTAFLHRGEKVSFLGGILGGLGSFLSHHSWRAFKELWRRFQPMAVPLLFAALVMDQPDMGTAMMILLFPMALYFISGMAWKEIGGTLAVCVIGAVYLAWIEPYRWERIKVALHPFEHAQDMGYQAAQSMIAIGSGGFLGQGPGEGVAKYMYLPEQHTDFAFAVFSQEWGFIPSVIVIIGYGAILFLGFRLAAGIPRLYPSLLVYGLSMMIGVQGLFNITMVTGIIPVTGVPLPFISYGGSAVMMNLIAVGLICRAVRAGEKAAEEDERKRRIEEMTKPVPLDLIAKSQFRP